MNAWTLENINKSIMFDVINVIDHVSRHKDDPSTITYKISLLKKNTIQLFEQVYKTAGEYDDSISSAMYIPHSESLHRWTLLYCSLYKDAINFNSFDDLVKFLRVSNPKENQMYILRGCLCEEQKTVPEDMLEMMIDTQDLISISILEKTHLPQKIKFSLTTLLLNYTEYIETLIAFLSKVHTVVKEVYEKYKTNYRYIVQMIKTYLNGSGADMLLDEDMRTIAYEEKTKRYTIILSLLRPECTDITFEKKRIIMICGLLYVQRILHDEQFELF